MKKVNYLLIIELFILFIAPSCSSYSKKILQGSSCKIPCWYDITPGETNYDNAYKILNSLRFVDANSIKNYKDIEHNIGHLSWQELKYNFLSGGGEIYFIDSTVLGIDLFPGNLNKINLSQAINIFGEPDSIFPILYIGEVRYMVIIFIYKNGVLLYHQTSNLKFNENVRINGAMKIESIIYYDTNKLNYLLENIFFLITKSDIENGIKPWSGYVSVEPNIIKP